MVVLTRPGGAAAPEADAASDARRPSRRAATVALLVAAIAFALAAAHDLPEFVYDDGGIFLRYAERIAAGLGLSYNDGERVNGCSSPLYALVLAGLLRAGVDPSWAVQLVGATAWAIACGLLVHALARHYSGLAACVGIAVLAGNEFLFASMFNGLETPITVMLAALLFLVLHDEREWPAGLVLGALVANKLDGGLAALAYAGAFVLYRRRFPLRAAIAAVLVFLPMALWLVASSGTLLPNSMTVKVQQRTPGGFAATWVLGKLERGAFWPLLLAPTSLAVVLRRRDARALPTVVIGAWAAMHVAVYSLVDLGDPYPWYVAPLVLSLAVLAAVGLDALARELAGALGRLHRSLGVAVRRALPVLGGIVALAHVDATLWPAAHDALPLARWLHGRPARSAAPAREAVLAAHSRGDLARLAAGAWLGIHAAPDEVLATAYGLPAYAYGGPVYDESGLNSAPDSPLRERAVYAVMEEEFLPAGRGWELVGEFRFADPRDSERASSRERANRYRVYARESSRVLREGIGHGVPGRIEAPLAAEDVPLGSAAWRAYLREVLPAQR